MIFLLVLFCLNLKKENFKSKARKDRDKYKGERNQARKERDAFQLQKGQCELDMSKILKNIKKKRYFI